MRYSGVARRHSFEAPVRHTPPPAHPTALSSCPSIITLGPHHKLLMTTTSQPYKTPKPSPEGSPGRLVGRGKSPKIRGSAPPLAWISSIVVPACSHVILTVSIPSARVNDKPPAARKRRYTRVAIRLTMQCVTAACSRFTLHDDVGVSRWRCGFILLMISYDTDAPTSPKARPPQRSSRPGAGPVAACLHPESPPAGNGEY